MMPELLPMTDPLAIYLNDHVGGSTAGVELIHRIARSHTGARRQKLDELGRQIEEDRSALLDMMARLEVPVRQYKVVAGWVGEKVGRFKPNGQLTGRAPLGALIELETMLLGVRGKAAGWQTLRIVAEHDDRLSVERLDELLARADGQSEALEQIRREVAAEVFVAG
jgi:hypothetical protein